MSTLAGMAGSVYAKLTGARALRTVAGMQRRDFLKIVGAASIAPGAPAGAAPPSPAATVLYDDRAIALERVGPDPAGTAGALWIRKRDLERVNGFVLKPQ